MRPAGSHRPEPTTPAWRSWVRAVGDESHRVTTFELFFDLVSVFAVTQITHVIEEEHGVMGVVRGAALAPRCGPLPWPSTGPSPT